jgi:hypothetical protein
MLGWSGSSNPHTRASPVRELRSFGIFEQYQKCRPFRTDQAYASGGECAGDGSRAPPAEEHGGDADRPRAGVAHPGRIREIRRATFQLGNWFPIGDSRIIEKMTSGSHRHPFSPEGAEGSDGRLWPHVSGGEGAVDQALKIGARLYQYLDAWRAIGKAYLIRNGLQPEWKGDPPPSNIYQRVRKPYTGVMHTKYMQQLQVELREGAIVEVRREQCVFLSPTFLVPKKGGEWRKVIDCRRVNSFIRDVTFQMEDHRTAAALIEKDQYAVSIDIRSAYHHVPVSMDLQPFLAFTYAGHFYQYRGMPFGIKHAPRVFTRVMHGAMVEIRRRWNVTSVQYLDDLLFLESDSNQLSIKIVEILQFLQQLGWSINWEKSNLTPSQRFVFLGVQWDTTSMQLTIENKRNDVLRKQVQQWLRWAEKGRRVPVRHLARLIGKLSQTRIQHASASLYLFKLNRMKSKGVLEKGWNGKLRLTRSVSGELLWWSNRLGENKPAAIRSEGKSVILCTDASPQGWGGWMQSDQDLEEHEWYVHGVWKEVVPHSSNYHEMIAVFFCLQHFIRINRMKGVKRVQLLTDNTTTMYDINKKRGAATLLYPLKLVINLLERHGMEMRATHLPGIHNNTADSLSRLARSGDYSLDRSVYQKGIRHLGVTPQVDLFANKSNFKCKRYVSVENDAEAVGRDAFSQVWSDFFYLIHPPIPLILRCLRKIIQDRTEAVMIVPAWQGQPWNALLRRVTVRAVEIGYATDILHPGSRMQAIGTLLPPGTLLMCLVRGSISQDGRCGTL